MEGGSSYVTTYPFFFINCLSHHLFYLDMCDVTAYVTTSVTISRHKMPCKNKLDVLYFVVASFTWLLRVEQEPFLPTHPKPERDIVICF